MSDWPVDRISSISERSSVSSSALGAAELHGGRGLLGEEPGIHLAAAGGGGQHDEIGLDVLVGVEDVGEQCIGCAAGDAGEVGTDAVALSLPLVAGLAVLDEDGLAANGVAGQLERGLIAVEHGRALRRRELGQHGRGAVAQGGIGQPRETVAGRGIQLFAAR